MSEFERWYDKEGIMADKNIEAYAWNAALSEAIRAISYIDTRADDMFRDALIECQDVVESLRFGKLAEDEK